MDVLDAIADAANISIAPSPNSCMTPTTRKLARLPLAEEKKEKKGSAGAGVVLGPKSKSGEMDEEGRKEASQAAKADAGTATTDLEGLIKHTRKEVDEIEPERLTRRRSKSW